MRLMIVILVLVALLFVDQFRFRGYYTSELSGFIVRVVQLVF
jgi:hypothetical protein